MTCQNKHTKENWRRAVMFTILAIYDFASFGFFMMVSHGGIHNGDGNVTWLDVKYVNAKHIILRGWAASSEFVVTIMKIQQGFIATTLTHGVNWNYVVLSKANRQSF